MTAPELRAGKTNAPASRRLTTTCRRPTPQQEMGLSNSTLHWLEDGEQAVPGRLTEPGTMPSYDPRAPGCRAAGAPYLVPAAPALIALIVAGWLYGQAQKRHAAEAPAPAVVEPARNLTNRAEAALAANRIDEALELAHLALVADPRFADAHFVVANVKQGAQPAGAARDEFRKYLELAPLGNARRSGAHGARSLCRRDPRRARPSAAPAAAGGSEGALCGRRTARCPPPIEAALGADGRGRRARAILAAVARRRRANRAEGQRLRTMLRYETALWTSGVTHVAGVDEAGMSPLAGPVAAAAVIFARGTRIPDVDDSKRLTAEERERLAPIIRERARRAGRSRTPRSTRSTASTSTGPGWRRCAGRSRRWRRAAEHLLIDAPAAARRSAAPAADHQGRRQEPVDRRGVDPGEDGARRAHARAGRRVPRLRLRPAQGLSRAAHFRGLRRLGACPIHRRSFAVVREVLGLPPLPPWPTPDAGPARPSAATDAIAQSKSTATPVRSSAALQRRDARGTRRHPAPPVRTTTPQLEQRRCRAHVRPNFRDWRFRRRRRC